MKGKKSLEVIDSVDWRENDEIILSSTSQNPENVEYAIIDKISSKSITLKTNLMFNHFGDSGSISTSKGPLDMRGEAGLISRNVVIRGEDLDDWGCRVMTIGYTNINQKLQDKIDGISKDDSVYNIEGYSHLEGVLIQNCGQRDTTNAAVSF